MNYEEMLDAREGVASHKEELPLGVFYRKLIDKKYRNVVELRSDLKDCIGFGDALKSDAVFSNAFGSASQVCFQTKEDSNGIYEIELDSGNYQSYEQLLIQNPAVVASNGYVDRVISTLATVLKRLHEKQVYQVCLAPQSIFVRKNDDMPLLLCHGSFYKSKAVKELLYNGYEQYVAPEVLAGGEPDERSDVYALARFIERLHADSRLGYEYKSVVQRATAEDPERRFADVGQMMDAVAKKRSMRRSVIALLAAVAIALLCVWAYVEMIPETVDIEFVKPAQQSDDDPYDVSITPSELGVVEDDSLALSGEEGEDMSAADAKLEEIFRRQFTTEAERVLSKMYSKERMTSSEQSFIASSNMLMEDLIRKRDELVSRTGMSNEKAEEIAASVIEKIRAEKKKQLKSYGYQKSEED